MLSPYCKEMCNNTVQTDATRWSLSATNLHYYYLEVACYVLAFNHLLTDSDLLQYLGNLSAFLS